MVWPRRGSGESTGSSDGGLEHGDGYLLRLLERGRRFEDEWRSTFESTGQLLTVDLGELDEDLDAGWEQFAGGLSGLTEQAHQVAPERPAVPSDDLIRLVAAPSASAASASAPSASAPAAGKGGFSDTPVVPAADPREATMRFRRSAVALALSTEAGDAARGHARECAAALLGLAAGGHESALASIVRADPDSGDSTWTVACYQIGDLSPSALKDFPESATALMALARCETPAHVAAELIVTNGDGVRWTALVRSGAEVVFQPLGKATASAASPSVMLGVRHRWEDQLLGWASCLDKGLDPVPTAAPPKPQGATAATMAPQSDDPAAATAGAQVQSTALGGDPFSVGAVMGQVLEAVRNIERRLPEPAVEPALPKQSDLADVAGLRNGMDDLNRQARELREQLAATQALLTASEQRVASLESEVRGIAARAAAQPQHMAPRQHAVPSLRSVVAHRVLDRLADWCDRRYPMAMGGSASRSIEMVPVQRRRSDWPA